MRVRFRTQVLRRCYVNIQEANRNWGKKIARKYIERVNILYGAESGAVLKTLPHLRFHQLVGKRSGQYALNLDNFWRLIVSFDDSKQREVSVEEVSKHYGD